MDIGLITPASDWNEVDDHVSAHKGVTGLLGATPDIYPVLHRLGSEAAWDATLAALGAIPDAALYLTPPDDPDGILAGTYDDELDTLSSDISPTTIVRFAHEADADWSPSFPAHWTRWAPERWAEVYVYVVNRVGGRDFACWTWQGRDNIYEWWPYAKALKDIGHSPDIVGFDAYVQVPRPDLDLAKRYRPSVALLRDWFPGSAVGLGEFGVAPGSGRRKVHRSVFGLRGVEFVVCYWLGGYEVGPRIQGDTKRLMRR